MTNLWYADCRAPMTDEWRGLVAFDGARQGVDPGTYRGNRVGQISPTAAGIPATYGNHPLVYYTQVNGGDQDFWTASGARTELLQVNVGVDPPGPFRRMRQGEERYIAYQVLVTPGFSPPSWCAPQQNKGEGTGNGPLSLYWGNNRWSLEKSGSQTYGSTNIGSVWSAPNATPRNLWARVCIGVRWSTGGDGWYQLHMDTLDGRGYIERIARRAGWTLKFAANGGPVVVGPTMGCYMARPSSGVHRLYWGGFNVATTREEAEAGARFFGSTGGGPTDPPPAPAPGGPVDVTSANTRAGFYTLAESQLLRTDGALNP